MLLHTRYWPFWIVGPTASAAMLLAGLALTNGCSSAPTVPAPVQDGGAEGDAPADAPADAPTDTPKEDVPAPPSCSDGEKNGEEEAIDCGGPCPLCPGAPCTKTDECASNVCTEGVCQAPSCTDNVKNGEEEAIDCGGSCPLCPGAPCTKPDECATQVCTDGVCQAPSCTDKVKNGDEIARDCGGSCPLCQGTPCTNDDECVTKVCTDGACACPDDMVAVPAIGGGRYCVDATEVTVAQYYEFVVENPPADQQPVFCSWNTLYVPKPWQPDPNDTMPVVNIDWCDAFAYCRWNKKRLCGADAYAGYADASKSEWFNACSTQGGNDYPYGNDYMPGKCFGAEAFTDTTPGPQDVLEHKEKNPGCKGGWPGLFDMSGNVAEWEDSCEVVDGQTRCRIRGGSYASDPSALRCDADAFLEREKSSPTVGFRCCR